MSRSPHLLLDPRQLGGHSRISGGKHLHLLPRLSPGVHPRVVRLGTSDTPTDHSCKQSEELREIEKEVLVTVNSNDTYLHVVLSRSDAITS